MICLKTLIHSEKKTPPYCCCETRNLGKNKQMTKHTPILFLKCKQFIEQIKSNQIKSLLLSHHHSTSALVSEILMSVLQTVQKNNRQFTYGQTVQKKQQTIYIWTDSAKKLHWSIYSAPDSAKKTTAIYIWTDSAKKQQTIYIWTDSAKKQYILDSTYLQKTMCKIHIHILSTHSVLYRHTQLSTTHYTPYGHIYIMYSIYT